MKFRFGTIALLLAVCGAVSSAPAPETTSRIIATTSWTAAFAYAAGADDVRVLAPYEMRHPPEYELSPSDLALISGARLIIYAGYEGMVPRIREAVGAAGPDLIQIATDYSPATIEASITVISAKLGTQSVGAASIREIAVFYGDWSEELQNAGLAGVEVITHAFHAPLATALGAKVIGTFGPAPLEARQIAALSALPAKLIIDNYHNDVGKPLRETMGGVPVVEFVNFPGTAGTVTLLDVLRENRRRLKETLSR